MLTGTTLENVAMSEQLVNKYPSGVDIFSQSICGASNFHRAARNPKADWLTET